MGTYRADDAILAAVIPKPSARADVDAARGFSESVEPHLQTMLRLARRLGRDAAEDIVQEALTRAWAKRAQYDGRRGSFGAWLLSITADQAYKSWRWHFRHARAVERRAGDDPSPETFIDLERALSKLPQRQRLAVDCFYFAGLSIAETASVMKCSEGTVKSTLSDARSALRISMR